MSFHALKRARVPALMSLAAAVAVAVTLALPRPTTPQAAGDPALASYKSTVSVTITPTTCPRQLTAVICPPASAAALGLPASYGAPGSTGLVPAAGEATLPAMGGGNSCVVCGNSCAIWRTTETVCVFGRHVARISDYYRDRSTVRADGPQPINEINVGCRDLGAVSVVPASP